MTEAKIVMNSFIDKSSSERTIFCTGKRNFTLRRIRQLDKFLDYKSDTLALQARNAWEGNAIHDAYRIQTLLQSKMQSVLSGSTVLDIWIGCLFSSKNVGNLWQRAKGPWVVLKRAEYAFDIWGCCKGNKPCEWEAFQDKKLSSELEDQSQVYQFSWNERKLRNPIELEWSWFGVWLLQVVVYPITCSVTMFFDSLCPQDL